MGPRDVKAASENKSDPEGNPRPRKTTETPGGLRQTSVYLRPDEFEALYQRSAEETAQHGVRVSIGEILRRALRNYLNLTD